MSLLAASSALAGVAWTSRGPQPPGRSEPVIAYDTARPRLVMFGGTVAGAPSSGTYEWDGVAWSGTGPLDDTWEHDQTGWRLVPGAGAPPARLAHAMAYDAARGRVVLFGGDVLSADPAGTWEWDGTDWTRIALPAAPPARLAHAMAYDPARGRTVLFGGESEATGLPVADVWEYDGLGWTDVTPASGPRACS